MKIKSFCLIIISLVFLSSISCQADNLITGKWVQPLRTKGDLGGIFIFYEEGKSTFIYGAIVESKYTIEGNTLIEFHQGNNSDQQILKYSISVNNEYLIMSRIDFSSPRCSTNELKMERIGKIKSTSKLVVGKWSYDHSTGAKALVEYTTDGRILLCVPMVYETGNYILDGDTLTIKMANGKTYTRQIKLEKERLILLKTKDKKEEIYDKFS